MFETVQAAAPAAENTDGIFSTRYELKGDLAQDFTPIMTTLKGKGVITVTNAQIKGMQLFNHIGKVTKKDELSDPKVEEIVMDTEIKDAKVWIKPFSFQVGVYHAEMEGSNGFDNTLNYVLWISRPPLNKIKIPFHVTGTVDNPVIKLGKGHENFDFSDF
jgi:AsmA protein